jgi:predicted nucleic-acid-binding protein
MKDIDTNILVRFLVGDDELQTKKVYKILCSVFYIF